MTPKQHQLVYNIAKRSRLWAEARAKSYGYPYDLCGMCAITAGHLHRALRQAGFKSVIACGPFHCFVLLNGYVVDVTATQFEGHRNRKVLIRPLTALRNTSSRDSSGNHWIIDGTFVERYRARIFQMENGWYASETVATPAVAGA